MTDLWPGERTMRATVSRPVNEEERRALRTAWRAAIGRGLRIVNLTRAGQKFVAFARDQRGQLYDGVGASLPAAVGRL